ncbi:MAG: phosphoenolpyruvate--protein phosphotransferase [Candidatus Eisenbacteria bacterium]|uniref:Phosphoenolpyruvate-protein phosphotransferase n=1 Tax=Eiseniibacteriota bacterium TaxID=2212470 RepID=A0A538UC55_UNCEI|nr:MAG: phosphoenolpyruvate--protein phosphotransferase [Candidatus Eisenbacteria bacterium]
MRFQGIAASPGIGVGPVHVIIPEDHAVKDFPIAADRVEAEIAFFESALQASRRDLEQIRHGIAHELGEQEATIYDAQMMMVDDPDLRRAVHESIRGRRNAGVSFRDYMTAVAARLERVQDEYLRERRSDILDVERRVLRHLMGDTRQGLSGLEAPAVIVAHEIGPSDVALLDRRRVLGFVAEVGGRTSHSAIVARGRGIPAVVAVRGVMQHVKNGDLGIVDGFRGEFELNPDAAASGRYRARRARVDTGTQALAALRDLPAVTPDGFKVDLAANIELPAEVEGVLEVGADGIGLFRTEFFYLDRAELPGEDEQYRAYRAVAERMSPRPVIFRTMDLGGDKVASYLGTTHETNPFLGYRGIRFALSHPEVFRAQIRAIYRASAHGRVRMMFPMISSLEELRAALDLCGRARAELDRAGSAYDRDLEVGLMIETPSAVWVADLLAREARFLSIGTNDLIQYTLAMDRDNQRMSHLYEPLSPAVLRSLRHTVHSGHQAQRWVGVCGEMAGDPRHAILLLGLGVDELSVSCFDLPRVKAALRSVPVLKARALAERALACDHAEAVRALLHAELDTVLPDYLLGDGDEA